MSARQAKEVVFRVVCTGGFLVAVAPLVALVAYAVPRAIDGLGPALSFARATSAPGTGGISHALLGSVVVVGIGTAIGVPLGILAGVFAAESRRLGRAARLAVDLLASLPPVVIGLLAYVAVVLPLRRHSALAGGVALALVILPLVARGTDALLRMVPASLRDVAISLGLSRWRVVLFALLPAVSRGVVATAAVATSRALGETAPLLYTSFHAATVPSGLLSPTPTLPITIWLAATSPHDPARAMAWAAALLLLVLALGFHALAWVLRGPAAKGTR